MASAKILLVEDEIITAEDIKNRLNDEGYYVTAVALSGQEAIDQAGISLPDLTLMDIKIQGGMDGIQTARHLRKQFDIPVVYITAYSDERLLRRAKKTEPLGFLVKPVGSQELRATMEIALYNSRMDKKLKESVKRLNLLVENFREVFCFWESTPNLCKKCNSKIAIKIQLGRLERGLFTLHICSECFDIRSHFEERAELTPRDLDTFSEMEGELKTKLILAEKHFIEQALALTKGNRSKAARLLKIAQRTMRYKLKKYGL